MSEEGERKQLDGSAKLSGGLLALIRAHRDAVEKVDMLVIIIRCVTEGRSPKFVSCVRIGQAELSQDPDEPFDSFKARAVIAAKASGSRFIMIYVAERYKQGCSLPVDDPLAKTVRADDGRRASGYGKQSRAA